MKNVLVVIDVQNDFVDGSLRNEEAIKKIPNIVKKINDFNGDYIFVTRDTHQENYLSTNEGKRLPVNHCIFGTGGWMINADVANALHKKELQESPIIVSYINKSTFGSFDLVEKLKNINDNLNITFVGYCTDICVVSNALLVKAAFYENSTITVDAACCAGVTLESHDAALTTMKMCQIDVINE